MSTKTEEKALQGAVEEAERELAELRQRKENAAAHFRKAKRRLVEIDAAIDKLAREVLSGDAGAMRHYKALEEQELEVNRTLRAACTAAEQLSGEIEVAKEKLENAEFEVRKAAASKRRQALEELHKRRDELAAQLEEVLIEEEKRFFPDRTRREISRWLRERYRDRLRVWLK